MDEVENTNTEAASEPTAEVKQESRGEQAMDAANKFKAEVQETMQQLKGGGLFSIFSFDRMYFPIIGRILFTIVSIAMIAMALIMIVANFTNGIGQGIGGLIGIPIMTFLMWLYMRIIFEVLMVAFKINEGIQDLNRKIK